MITCFFIGALALLGIFITWVCRDKPKDKKDNVKVDLNESPLIIKKNTEPSISVILTKEDVQKWCDENDYEVIQKETFKIMLESQQLIGVKMALEALGLRKGK